MNQRQKPQKRKGAAVAAVLCFVAAIAIVGTYTFRDYQKTKQEEELAKAEDLVIDTESSEEAAGAAKKDDEQEAEEPKDVQNPDASQQQSQNDQTQESPVRTSGSGKTAQFNSDSKLLWPVDGTILLNYSMDKTVYFSTLDQYKYNPALIISGAEGDQVICGAPGIVKSIDVNAQTGTTVNVDIGGGYELFYGQLKEVPVKVGDYVEAKSVLGYVSQPTKYYSVEGCNVYFEMRKDGQPVNPMEYLVE